MLAFLGYHSTGVLWEMTFINKRYNILCIYLLFASLSIYLAHSWVSTIYKNSTWRLQVKQSSLSIVISITSHKHICHITPNTCHITPNVHIIMHQIYTYHWYSDIVLINQYIYTASRPLLTSIIKWNIIDNWKCQICIYFNLQENSHSERDILCKIYPIRTVLW